MTIVQACEDKYRFLLLLFIITCCTDYYCIPLYLRGNSKFFSLFFSFFFNDILVTYTVMRVLCWFRLVDFIHHPVLDFISHYLKSAFLLMSKVKGSALIFKNCFKKCIPTSSIFPTYGNRI